MSMKPITDKQNMHLGSNSGSHLYRDYPVEFFFNAKKS